MPSVQRCPYLKGHSGFDSHRSITVLNTAVYMYRSIMHLACNHINKLSTVQIASLFDYLKPRNNYMCNVGLLQ